ncbi:MAG: DinB family protein [Vicinamibacteria bacterium]|nr:DinB family protein [Vicinamibacteria bacterium]
MDQATAIADLFRRDLGTLARQIRAFPADDLLWATAPGVTNPAGNIVLHLEGNLREYVGRQLGHVEYRRDRALEFSDRGLGREELAARVDALRTTIPDVVAALSSDAMAARYPETVLERPLTTHAFLVHLHGHLNWHLGQMDTLRRILTGEGAIERMGL